MKRRRRARHSQQPQHSARKRPTQPYLRAAAPPAPSVPACRTTSSASASSSSQQQTSRGQAHTIRHPQSPLDTVCFDVLVLVLQYLTARHKLAAVSHLSRAFHPLPALAFLHDPSTALLNVGAARDDRNCGISQPYHLWLTVRQLEQPGKSTLFSCPRSLRSLPQLSTLVGLVLVLELPPSADGTASLRCMLRSALLLLSLGSLRSLSISVTPPQQLPEADWTDTELPSTIGSLYQLYLSGVSLSTASVRRLCALPLKLLELNGCCALTGCEEAPLDSVAQQSGSGLENLCCRTPPSRELLSLIASHAQQLKTLSFTVCGLDLRSGPPVDFSPLITASRAACLPLLTELWLPIWRLGDDWNVLWQAELEQAFITTCQQLLAAYCGQLTLLSMPGLSASTLGQWLRLLSASGPQLYELRIVGLRVHSNALQTAALQLQAELQSARHILPGVRWLRVESLPLTDASLLALLSRCPELDFFNLEEAPYVTEAGMEAALCCCPRLRTCIWNNKWCRDIQDELK